MFFYTALSKSFKYMQRAYKASVLGYIEFSFAHVSDMLISIMNSNCTTKRCEINVD